MQSVRKHSRGGAGAKAGRSEWSYPDHAALQQFQRNSPKRDRAAVPAGRWRSDAQGLTPKLPSTATSRTSVLPPPLFAIAIAVGHTGHGGLGSVGVTVRLMLTGCG